jgi:uncharacterized protein YbjT (DUF2867 family)
MYGAFVLPPDDACADPPPILLTGATGYIGGRLLRRLEDAGRPVRCLTRRPEVLEANVDGATTVVAGDALAPRRLLPRSPG